MRHRIRIYGIVQGIGFRPFVRRMADRYGLSGSVCNKGSYVEIEASGSSVSLKQFEHDVQAMAPKAARIVHCEIVTLDDVCDAEREQNRFVIQESVFEHGQMFVSPDLAVCPDCERELFDPKNRRYLHPFINCTNCGPRVTILDAMPYDRERTSMRVFPMCRECEQEYTNPSDRRYHAQPVCCTHDGPRLEIIDPRNSSTHAESDDDAIRTAREILRNGGIVAIKGIGGFHLACDAGNEQAVQRLRTRKHRPAKPFAVMMKDLDTVERECVIGEEERQILTGTEKPILLLEKRTAAKFHTMDSENADRNFDTNFLSAPKLAASAAPDNPSVGVMLPYAPVQYLLFRYPDGKTFPDMLVMTSGNQSGAPIVRTTEEARESLAELCDLILTNNREIRLRADDSVMQMLDGKPYMIRRSRGYAPLPFRNDAYSGRFPEIIASGGELKNTFVLEKEGLFYPSPYVGDLEDRRARTALEHAAAHLETLLDVHPELTAADLHPRYQSVQFAKQYAEKHEIPLIQVQHHFAHIRSCAAENDRWNDTVIGVCFDGTGYGTDGTVWGGEFLMAAPDRFVRMGSIAPFLQAGGDAAAREGWRIAAAMLWELYGEKTPQVAEVLALCSSEELNVIRMMCQKRLNTVESTSAGRLFDAAAAVLGIRSASGFEGEAAMALQFAAQRSMERAASDSFRHHSADLPVEIDEPAGDEAGCGRSERKFVISRTKMFRELTEAMLRLPESCTAEERTHAVEDAALNFHRMLAESVCGGVQKMKQLTGLNTAALSGGVFQNTLLTKLCKELLEEQGFEVLIHSQIPANDGGISLGQAAAAEALWRKKHDR